MPAHQRKRERTRFPPRILSRRSGWHARTPAVQTRRAPFIKAGAEPRLLADFECEVSIDLVGVGRRRLPLYLVDAGLQWWQQDPNDHAIGFVDRRFALVHLLAGRIPHDDGTEFGLQLLAETERDFVRRRGHGGTDRRS